MLRFPHTAISEPNDARPEQRPVGDWVRFRDDGSGGRNNKPGEAGELDVERRPGEDCEIDHQFAVCVRFGEEGE